MTDERAPTNPLGLGAKGGMGDEPPPADDGESVGASDREADVRRSR